MDLFRLRHASNSLYSHHPYSQPQQPLSMTELLLFSNLMKLQQQQQRRLSTASAGFEPVLTPQSLTPSPPPHPSSFHQPQPYSSLSPQGGYNSLLMISPEFHQHHTIVEENSFPAPPPAHIQSHKRLEDANIDVEEDDDFPQDLRVHSRKQQEEETDIPISVSSSPAKSTSENGGRSYACPDCGKSYSTSSNLARHRQIHRSMEDKKARKCPHCEKTYVSMPAFSMHIRTHNQGCKCPHCGKCFSRPWLLQGHIRTHTGKLKHQISFKNNDSY